MAEQIVRGWEKMVVDVAWDGGADDYALFSGGQARRNGDRGLRRRGYDVTEVCAHERCSFDCAVKAVRAGGRPRAATGARGRCGIDARVAGVNDALAAEVIQVDVSRACYAGVEMVAAIKRACAQAGTIRPTIEATTMA